MPGSKISSQRPFLTTDCSQSRQCDLTVGSPCAHILKNNYFLLCVSLLQLHKCFISSYYTLLTQELVFALSQNKAMMSLARAWKRKHCIENYSSCLAIYVIKKYNNYSQLNITTVSHTRQNENSCIQQSLALRSLLDICIKILKYFMHEFNMQDQVFSIYNL